MARRPRYHVPNATYHVMLRGNNGQPIFFSEGDKTRLGFLLQRGIERIGHTIEAFCFMSNHIHLSVRVAEKPISDVVQLFASAYTNYVNKKYNRVGHIFQGRFRANLVEDDEYLKELLRYIHLNPVRAGLVSDPLQYAWSSHRVYMKHQQILWLSTDRMLKKFDYGFVNENPAENMQEYVLNGIGLEPKRELSECWNDRLLDEEDLDDLFVEDANHDRPKVLLSDLIAQVTAEYKMSQAELSEPGKSPKPSEARALIALLVRESDDLTLEGLAKAVAREPSSLTKSANRLQIRSFEDRELFDRIEAIRKWMKAR